MEESPRSDDAERPVPVRLPELPEELEAEEPVLPELSDVEMLPAEIDGMDGMEGPEIDGMDGIPELCAKRREQHAISRNAVEIALSLQYGKLFFDHFKA